MRRDQGHSQRLESSTGYTMYLDKRGKSKGSLNYWFIGKKLRLLQWEGPCFLHEVSNKGICREHVHEAEMMVTIVLCPAGVQS